MASAALRPQARPDLGRKTARPLVGLVTFAMAAAALSGCVPRSRPVERLPEPEPTQQQGPTRPSRLPADETRNRVAVLVPLTGRDAALGQSILNAANLALLDTGGERIRITAYDTAAGAVPAANEAWRRAMAVSSVRCWRRTFARSRRWRGGPMSPSSPSPTMSASPAMASTSWDSILASRSERVVAFARSRGVNRFRRAGAAANTYGERSARALTQAVEGEGGRIVGIQTFDPSPAGVRVAATRLSGQGAADAVLLADVPRALLPAVPLLRAASPAPRFLRDRALGERSGIGANVALARRMVRRALGRQFQRLPHPLPRTLHDDALSARQPRL